MNEGQSPIARLLRETLDELAIAVMLDGPARLTPETLEGLAEMADRDPSCKAFADAARFLLPGANTGEGWEAAAIERLQQHLQHCDGQTPPCPAVATTGSCVGEEPAPYDEDPEMLAGFMTEAEEHLAAIDEQILAVEKNPRLTEALHAVFRGFHTIKGLAGCLGLNRVQSVSHEVETLLDHARNGHATVDAMLVDAVLESAEYLRMEVSHLNSRVNGAAEAPPTGSGQLIARVRQITERALRSVNACVSGPSSCLQMNYTDDPIRETTIRPELLEESHRDPAGPPVEPGLQILFPAKSAARPTPSHTLSTSPTIRIETSKLDLLMDVVGEMVIAQSTLAHNPCIRGRQDARLAGDLTHLGRITREVQRRVMSMRMMPIGPLFQKNAKLVRDLARRQGKEVELELVGEGTELDKAIAEELSDPLLHMIRNAIDHGIETSQERIANGKPAAATLRLSAEHQSGHIVIAISDDGRGLNTERILNKARQKGLVAEGVPLTEEDVFQLIFAPGFSTAEAVTDLSGRGVGMDVVRKHVENLRGDIQIRSKQGKGTTFLVHLPLTLAIIEGLVIVVGAHRYIIPIFSVREILRPTTDMVYTVQGREETVLLRGRLVPLVRLHRRFEIEPRSEDVCEGLLVVCEYAAKQFALFVDDLAGRQEIVIKSLGSTFQNTTGLSGCAILGDGQIGLILDVAGIYRMPNASRDRCAA